MSNGVELTKNLQPKIDYSEHDTVNGVHAKKVIVIGSDGNQFLGGGFNLPAYDYIAVTYPTTSSETYTFKSGGSNGDTVATITATYTDDSKESLLSVERS